MVSQVIDRAQVNEERGSGRIDTAPTPPAYIWVDESDQSRCIAFEWIGTRKLDGTVTRRYRVRLQVRGLGSVLLGGIERVDSQWFIFAIDRNLLQSGESFDFPNWDEAARYLYQQHLNQKRAKVRTFCA